MRGGSGTRAVSLLRTQLDLSSVRRSRGLSVFLFRAMGLPVVRGVWTPCRGAGRVFLRPGGRPGAGGFRRLGRADGLGADVPEAAADTCRVSPSGETDLSQGRRRSAASGRASRSWVQAARISHVQRSASSRPCRTSAAARRAIRASPGRGRGPPGRGRGLDSTPARVGAVVAGVVRLAGPYPGRPLAWPAGPEPVKLSRKSLSVWATDTPCDRLALNAGAISVRGRSVSSRER